MNNTNQAVSNDKDVTSLDNGLGKLSDSELIANYIGGKKEDRIMKAELILAKHGCLGGLMKHARNPLAVMTRNEKVACDKLLLALELSKRCIESKIRAGSYLSSPDETRNYIATICIGKQSEIFGVVFMDTRRRVITSRIVAVGTVDHAVINIREIVRAALALNASSILAFHNHPSGLSNPSDSDVRITRKLTDAMSLIDVDVEDHVISGDGVMTSLAERGLM